MHAYIECVFGSIYVYIQAMGKYSTIEIQPTLIMYVNVPLNLDTGSANIKL